jgi:hypothetical protein
MGSPLVQEKYQEEKVCDKKKKIIIIMYSSLAHDARQEE